MASAEQQQHHLRFVSKLFPESLPSIDSESIQIDKKSASETMMMVQLNKENNSSDLNTGVKSARNPVDKDLDSNSSEARAFSPRPTISGLTASIVASNKASPSPPLPSRIPSMSSSPASSLCSPTFTVQTPPLIMATGAADHPGNKSPIGLNRHSAFNIASSVAISNGQKAAEGAHLLSQHLLELNQMRPHGQQSPPPPPTLPPYKFFQDNAFYQSRQLLNGHDLSEFKLNVQMKEKQVREAFATASEATSEDVVVDGNDEDGTEDSQQNTVSNKKSSSSPTDSDCKCFL